MLTSMVTCDECKMPIEGRYIELSPMTAPSTAVPTTELRVDIDRNYDFCTFGCVARWAAKRGARAAAGTAAAAAGN